ncbi:MAG: hypothetical protein ACYCPA_01010 [Acidithiobacillus sp.]
MYGKHLVLAAGIAALAGCAAHHHLGPYGGHSTSWYAHHVHRAELENKWCDDIPAARQEIGYVKNNCTRSYLGWGDYMRLHHLQIYNDTMG